jgi:hypothetical protein
VGNGGAGRTGGTGGAGGAGDPASGAGGIGVGVESGLVAQLGAVVVSVIDVKLMLHILFVKGFFQIFSNHAR